MQATYVTNHSWLSQRRQQRNVIATVILGVVGFLPSESARSEEQLAADDFVTRELSSEQAVAIVERASYLQQDAPSRPQIDANQLRQMNAVPQLALRVDNATFYLTRPLAFYGGRQLALAFVEVDGDTFCRVLYRSNSQFTWRMCDATDGGHIGKGFHEFDKQVPIPVSATLLASHDDLQTLQQVDGLDSQPALSKHLLHGLTLDRRSSQCISQNDGYYFTREYVTFMPSLPMPFSNVTNWLATATPLRVADPSATTLPICKQLPEIRQPITSFAFSSPAYARVNGGSGKLTGRVFLSFDNKVRYLFFEDDAGRVSLSVIESLSPEINALGLRGRYFDSRGMDSPLIEYYLQIPEQYGGSKAAGYRSNWNYVRELPIIQYYYAERGKEVPNAIAD